MKASQQDVTATGVYHRMHLSHSPWRLAIAAAAPPWLAKVLHIGASAKAERCPQSNKPICACRRQTDEQDLEEWPLFERSPGLIEVVIFSSPV
jgi:hypothetical protein